MSLQTEQNGGNAIIWQLGSARLDAKAFRPVNFPMENHRQETRENSNPLNRSTQNLFDSVPAYAYIRTESKTI